MTKREKWKLKNLGLLGYIKHKLQKKIYVNFDGRVLNNNENDKVTLCDDWKPFLLVKPCGTAKVKLIISILNKQGFQVDKVLKIDNYDHVMCKLFTAVDMKEAAYWTQINQLFYADDTGNVTAYILLFNFVSISSLQKLKIVIRRKCGIDFFTVRDGDNVKYETSITPVHVPDETDMQKEYSIAVLHAKPYDLNLI